MPAQDANKSDLPRKPALKAYNKSKFDQIILKALETSEPMLCLDRTSNDFQIDLPKQNIFDKSIKCRFEIARSKGGQGTYFSQHQQKASKD